MLAATAPLDRAGQPDRRRTSVRYEIVSPTTGEVMALGYPEWLRLLALASRYGGLPGEGLYHYYEEEGAVIPEETAGDMAEALAEAERDLRVLGPRRPEDLGPSAESATAADPEALLGGPKEGALAYFAGDRRAAISGFVRMGRTGELEVTRHRS
jgi:hypothetical protein